MQIVKIPFPPSANVYWRTDMRSCHNYVSEKAREYKTHVAALLWSLSVLDKPLVIDLTLEYHFPTEVGDLSNRIKVLEDALIGVVYKDDIQIVGHRTSRILIPPIKKIKAILSTKRVGFVIVGIEVVERAPQLFDEDYSLRDYGLLD